MMPSDLTLSLFITFICLTWPSFSAPQYFIKLIKKKYNKDVSKDARALQKLRREAERAKRALSSQHQVRTLYSY